MPLINHMSPMTSGEKLWFETQADKDKRYIHHPCCFHLPSGKRYTPDFYCMEDNVFIELVCTRQAFHQNKHKYDEMNHCYPEVTFQIVKVYVGNLSPYEVRPPRRNQSIDRIISKRHGISQTRVAKARLGDTYITDPLVAVDLANATGNDPLSFINPIRRERYAAAFPFMVDRNLPIPESIGPNPTKIPRRHCYLSSDLQQAVND